MKNRPRGGLGRGLGALIPTAAEPVAGVATAEPPAGRSEGTAPLAGDASWPRSTPSTPAEPAQPAGPDLASLRGDGGREVDERADA